MPDHFTLRMSSFDVPTRTYLLRPGGASELLGALGTHLGGGDDDRGRGGSGLEAVARPARTASWCAFDTADRRLRAAGLDLRLELPARSARSGRSEQAGDPGRRSRQLVLRSAGDGHTTVAPAGRSARKLRAADLPDGPLKDRLAPVVGVRALLPVVQLRRRDHPVEVHNGDDKTVVRLTLSDLWAAPGTERVPLPGRVEVAGVLGYAKAFARIDRVLEGELGLEPATSPVVDDALAATGGGGGGGGGGASVLTIADLPPVVLAPGQPAGEAAVRILRRKADVVEANLPGTLDDLDPEFLHDLRVAVRSSRSVLREMRSVFDPGARRAQADALRWIQAVTGPTRDLDVQLLEWDDQVVRLPAERRGDLDVAHQVLVARRAAAFRAMRATLRGADFQERWAAWRRFLDQQAAGGGSGAGDSGTQGRPGPDAGRPVREVAGRRVRSVYRRMVRDGSAIDDGSPAEALHDLRKRGKELRYLLELFGSVLPRRRVRRMVAELKRLQDVLGRHQDCDVQAANQRDLAPELATLPGGPEALLAMGVLIDRLRIEQRRARSQFADRFASFVELKVPA